MKKILKYILTLVLVGSLTSCGENFFDDARQQSNIATDLWGSTIDLERLIAGAYYGVSSYEGFRGIHGLQMVHEALISDVGLLHTAGVTDDWQNDVYNRRNARNDIPLYAWMWRGAYQGAALANEVIGWVEKNGPFKDQYGPIWTDRILGEAHFLRAWIYFTLARIHSPAYGANNSAPSIILNIAPSKEGFANPPRATVQEVYAQIVKDLENAVRLLPETYNAQRDPIDYQDRANRDAARFLLARVHFQMKNFAKAKEMCDAIISGGRYNLSEAPIEAWNKTGSGARGREVVWQYVQFNTAQQQWKSSPVGSYLGFQSRGNNNINGGRTISASDAFLTAAGWTPNTFQITALPTGRPPAVLGTGANFTITGNPDLRLQQLWRAIPAGFDPRPEFTAYTRTYVWCNKWNRTAAGVNNNLFSLPLMRLAEIHLTRAIIRFRDGDRTGAAEDLNLVRRRAGLAAITAANLTENDIHTERMRELAFEEDRTYYLQALNLPIPAGDREGGQMMQWNAANFAMPIPAIEADLNPSVRN